MAIHDNRTTSLKALGMNETWLRDWIEAEPARLGLGPLEIKAVEVQHSTKSGGRLDILAYRSDLDTYYEIELMLGEVNADHGFRCLDYWARERLKKPNARHVAVLVAEDLQGRYQTVIETLPNFLPFIAVELRVLQIKGQEIATIVPLIVAQPDDMILGAADQPAGEGSTGSKNGVRDREWWEANASQGCIATVDALVKLCETKVGPSSVDYSASSYISLKKGKRCWLPMWKRKEGVYVYIPGGPGGSEDSPSDFFQRVRDALVQIGMEEPSWTYKYNAGANPVGFAIPLDKAQHSVVLELLKEAYELV
jgi:hypothetical protein